MSELIGALNQLDSMFGNEVTVYASLGSSFSDSDEFWPEEDGWETDGTPYHVLVEDSPSNDTLEQSGFSNKAESAIWTTQDIANEGYKVEYRSRDWVVVSKAVLQLSGAETRFLLGIRSLEG